MSSMRLTKLDIERSLLTGATIAWKDTNGKNCQLALNDPKERRLFDFLLTTKDREPTGLRQEFIDGLSTAYDGTYDPASTVATATATASTAGTWRLQSIVTEGFGGLNIWGGPPFYFNFDQESLLVEGPNGSGKSSLIGAILWALTGERPREQSDSCTNDPKPVFGSDDKPAGNWPPIACYPPSAADLKLSARVRVQLTFQDQHAGIAKVERIVEGSKVTFTTDPVSFEVPSILLETGLLMPARLAHIRFNDGSGRLTDAVQKLTGLDELVAIGGLVVGLCHGGREYLSFKRKDLTVAMKAFDVAIAEARDALAIVKVPVPNFIIAQTDNEKSEMANFGRMLNDRAAELTQIVASDLASGLDLTNASVQQQIISAIGVAQEDLKLGIEGLPSWKTLQSIAQSLDEETAVCITEAITKAHCKAEEAVQLQDKSSKDSKLLLKTVAAQWHAQHKTGIIENCPLCEQDLKSVPLLAQELESLRSLGEGSARKFKDNLNAISAELESSLPASAKKYGIEVLTLEPRAKLINDLRATFVEKDRYAKTLLKFKMIVETTLSSIPVNELAAVQITGSSAVLKGLNDKIAVIERLLSLAAWFRANSDQWVDWWRNIAATETSQEDVTLKMDVKGTSAEKPPERLSAHLLRLSDVLAKAEPYKKAAAAMRKAWTSGKSASEIDKELKRRDAIAEILAPLKNLVPLAEFVAREAITELSDRIATLLKQIHITEKLQFHNTRLYRKEGLVVRGGFVPDLRIDATLVANTSWLRAVLWAFLFALREEAVEQMGTDQFPLLVFDDPQSNFDAQHRHRWGSYIASLQSDPSKAQIILATYDEIFLQLIKVEGVTGRQAMIVAAGEELGHIGIFEGEFLTRKWTETQLLNTPQAGRDYMGKVREFVEGLLRLMLRGEDAAVLSVVSGYVLGDCREKIHQLNTKGIAPWDRPQFKKLVNALDKNLSAIKHMEMAHHASGTNLGMAEATDVEAHWQKKLKLTLDNCFQLVREHHLLHGGFKALHAGPVTATLPDGYAAKVQTIPLQLLGRAAACSDGRMADGRFDLDEFALTAQKKFVLGRHFAYRLTAQTLEPVAQLGDMLLVKELGEPPEKSLVVALNGDRIFARRFDIAENQSDVAVLTAQAINPRQIAQPVIAQKATFKMHKIIGVIYEEKTWCAPTLSEMEVCECAGESLLTGIAARHLGLVEVVGQSAEPLALNGQYLIVGKEIAVDEAMKTLDGKPIIACDSNDNRYFKRLRIMAIDQIVLESLDGGGYYGPVLLSPPKKGKNCLERVWPVVGVLFELPS